MAEKPENSDTPKKDWTKMETHIAEVERIFGKSKVIKSKQSGTGKPKNLEVSFHKKESKKHGKGNTSTPENPND